MFHRFSDVKSKAEVHASQSLCLAKATVELKFVNSSCRTYCQASRYYLHRNIHFMSSGTMIHLTSSLGDNSSIAPPAPKAHPLCRLPNIQMPDQSETFQTPSTREMTSSPPMRHSLPGLRMK